MRSWQWPNGSLPGISVGESKLSPPPNSRSGSPLTMWGPCTLSDHPCRREPLAQKNSCATFDLEVAKGCHKVLDLAGRRGFAGFEVALNA